MKKKTNTTYANTVLADRLRDEGFSIRCLWEIEAPTAGTAWLTCYVFRGTPERPGFGVVIVQTLEREGWEAWMPAHDGVEINATVQAVIDRLTTAKTPEEVLNPPKADAVLAALKVIVLDPSTRAWLEKYDPKALAQAHEALGMAVAP